MDRRVMQLIAELAEVAAQEGELDQNLEVLQALATVTDKWVVESEGMNPDPKAVLSLDMIRAVIAFQMWALNNLSEETQS